MGILFSLFTNNKSSASHFHECNDCYLFILKRGQQYGYPPCCIESFCGILGGLPILPIQAQAKKHRFIPCRSHSLLIVNNTIKIEDIILPTRTEQHPFSNSDHII